MESWKHFIKYCQRPGMIRIHTFNRVRTLIDRLELSRGAKIGAVSGAIYGAVIGPIMYFGIWAVGWLTNVHWRSFESLVAEFMQPWFLYPIKMSFAYLMFIIPFLIIGLFFGLLFEADYDKLPGKTPEMKGIVISIFHWATLFIFFFNHWVNVVMGLGTSILWGWLLGHFWARERRKEIE